MNRRLWSLVLAALLMLGILAGCRAGAPDSSFRQEDTLQLIEDSTQDTASPPQSAEQEPTEEETEAPEQTAEPEITEEAASGLETSTEAETAPETETEPAVQEDGEYTSPEDVALYIHTFGHLPDNYITKNEARDLGWDSSQGNLWDVAPGKSIGGDRFGNYEGLLPEGNYRECDVNYEGGYRGAERLIYSQDGSVYYTNDHYKSFTQLY